MSGPAVSTSPRWMRFSLRRCNPENVGRYGTARLARRPPTGPDLGEQLVKPLLELRREFTPAPVMHRAVIADTSATHRGS